MGALLDLTNKRVGMLVALYALPAVQYGKHKRTRWMCICDCGNSFIAWTMLLAKGKQKSCGCLTPPAPDLTGERRGMLSIVERITTTTYRCICDCGTEKIIASIDLKQTRSCGCSRRGRVLGPVKRYDVDGEMLTISEMASRVGVTQTAIYARLSRGLSPKEAMKPPTSRWGHRQSSGKGSAPWNVRRYHLADGRELTLEEIASEVGVTESAMRNRMSDGLTVDQAMAMGKDGSTERYEIFGKMLTVTEIVAISGRDRARLSRRLKRMSPIEAAFGSRKASLVASNKSDFEVAAGRYRVPA